ncbi:MAG: hypothetical protein A2508_00995 [Candidatus Lambdaproteobacteria bacterium RIFOXYD12_FULL_49_8]|nr:MAG: hypothetical protein A2508_00995 [Candidatus Lambdaproteobacteria bacterium RIFOXYD12_FULL_49_8]
MPIEIKNRLAKTSRKGMIEERGGEQPQVLSACREQGQPPASGRDVQGDIGVSFGETGYEQFEMVLEVPAYA